MTPLTHNGHTIPGKCVHVFEALNGKRGHTDYTKRTGRYRYIDLIQLTGRNSTDRKLRELIESCRGLVMSETVNGKDGRFKTFWLAGGGNVESMPITAGTDGALFSMPGLGRPE